MLSFSAFNSMDLQLATLQPDILAAEAAFIEARIAAVEAMAVTAKKAVDYAALAKQLLEECASDAQFHARLVQLGSQLPSGEVDKLLRFATKVEHQGVALFTSRSTAVQAQVEMGLLPERSDHQPTTPKRRKPADAIAALARAVKVFREVTATHPLESWSSEEKGLLIALRDELLVK